LSTTAEVSLSVALIGADARPQGTSICRLPVEPELRETLANFFACLVDDERTDPAYFLNTEAFVIGYAYFIEDRGSAHDLGAHFDPVLRGGGDDGPRSVSSDIRSYRRAVSRR
jgi:hypothetical protein